MDTPVRQAFALPGWSRKKPDSSSRVSRGVWPFHEEQSRRGMRVALFSIRSPVCVPAWSTNRKGRAYVQAGTVMLCSAALLASSAWVHGGDSIQGDLYQYSAKSNESGSGMGDTSSGIYGGWSTLPSAGRTGLANSVTMSSTPPGMVSRTASSAAAGTMRIGSAERNSADQAHDMPTR